MNTAMATFKFSKPLLNVTHADMTCGDASARARVRKTVMS